MARNNIVVSPSLSAPQPGLTIYSPQPKISERKLSYVLGRKYKKIHFFRSRALIFASAIKYFTFLKKLQNTPRLNMYSIINQRYYFPSGNLGIAAMSTYWKVCFFFC
jgi:hypothetical protein